MQLKVLILISLVFATLAAAASFPTPTNSANLEDSFPTPTSSPSSEVHSNQNRGFIDFVTSLLEYNPDDNGATVVHPF